MPLTESAQQWMVGIVLILLVGGLVREQARPSLLFFLALTVLTLCGILSPEEMLSGFSNSQVAVVVLLLVIGNVINRTTVVPALFDRVFKRSTTYTGFLSKMTLAVGSTSAFMNNTPLVAMLIPYVYNWGKRNGISPSKLLIPLSYATIAGGMITVIGTSTNLIVNGLLESDGLPKFSMFEFAPFGLPVLALLWIYMMTIGRRLLPDHKDPLQEVQEVSRPFLTEMVLSEGSPMAGKAVEEVSTLFLRGLMVVAIFDENQPVSPVNPQEILHGGDRLIIKGSTEAIAAVLAGNAGLQAPEVKKYDPGTDLDLVEIVVSYNSSLAHKRVTDTNFRKIFGASIVAVHRPEENIFHGIGDVVLHPGDVLMVQADKSALAKFKETSDFHVISREPAEPLIGGWKAWVAGGSFFLAILLNAFELLNLFSAALVLLALFYFLKITNFREIQRSLDVDLVLVLALSIGLGRAIKNAHLDVAGAAWMNSWLGDFGVAGALAGIYLFTNVLTQLISNAAAATVAFPLAIATAQVFGAQPAAFAMAVAFGASLDFSTPIGYQTNLMVYGPGGYKFTDYVKVGAPLNILLMILVVAMICWWYGLV